MDDRSRRLDAHLVMFDPGTPYTEDPDGAGRDLRTSIAAATATLHAVGGALDRAAQILANAALDESTTRSSADGPAPA